MSVEEAAPVHKGQADQPAWNQNYRSHQYAGNLDIIKIYMIYKSYNVPFTFICCICIPWKERILTLLLFLKTETESSDRLVTLPDDKWSPFRELLFSAPPGPLSSSESSFSSSKSLKRSTLSSLQMTNDGCRYCFQRSLLIIITTSKFIIVIVIIISPFMLPSSFIFISFLLANDNNSSFEPSLHQSQTQNYCSWQASKLW